MYIYVLSDIFFNHNFSNLIKARFFINGIIKRKLIRNERLVARFVMRIVRLVSGMYYALSLRSLSLDVCVEHTHFCFPLKLPISFFL